MSQEEWKQLKNEKTTLDIKEMQKQKEQGDSEMQAEVLEEEKKDSSFKTLHLKDLNFFKNRKN